MPASNGGTATLLNIALYPMVQGITSNNLYKFDPTTFDDQLSSSFYDYKVEDIIAGRTATISRAIVSYRDLGVATFLLNISGTTDAQTSVNFSQLVTIGNAVPLNTILTVLVPFVPVATGQNLQASIIRNAAGGPVSITKLRLEGRVEITPYA